MELKDVMSLGEAAKTYNVSPETLRKACSGQHGAPPRFTPEECRKSGDVWIITRAGLERLYSQKNKH